MDKDEVLKLALEALEYASTGNRRPEVIGAAITAIKQALAAPVQEPVAWMHPDWPDGYSGFQSPVTTYMTNGWIPLYTTPPAAPVHEPVAICQVYPLRGNESIPTTRIEWIGGKPVAGPLYTTPPAAPVHEPNLSGLKTSAQEAIKKWIADGTFIERAIGAMKDQERENMRLEKMVAAPVQEPVGEVCGYYERGFDAEKTRYGKLYDQDLPLGIKLYTTPPAAQRQWVGLTDEEIEDWWDGYLSGYQLQMIRELEAKLKEKNNG